MFRYGNKVVIRDGSSLDGTQGIIYDVKNTQILVLLEREVIWPVSPEHLELLAPVKSGSPAG